LKFLPFLELLSALSGLKEGMFQIKDYSLSYFMVYYEGSDDMFYKYIRNHISDNLIEYNFEILINSPQLERPQLRKIDYSKKDSVEEYVNEIMHIG
jgi:hypothetical protein